jgi:uncharacterized repeat protein (TIGR01451 family)
MNARRWLGAVVMLLLGGSSLTAQVEQPRPLIEIEQKLPKQVLPGESITLEIFVNNVGTAPAHGLTLTTELPSSYALESASPTAEQSQGHLSWAVFALKPREQFVARVRLNPLIGVPLSTVKTESTVTYLCSFSKAAVVEIKPRQGLSVAVSGPETSKIDERVPLQITIRNQGTEKLQNLLMHTQLTPGLFHPYGSDLEKEIGSLDAGQSTTVDLEVTPRCVGDLLAKMRVEGQGVAPAECEVHLRVQDMRLTIAANGPNTCYQNWPCTYDFTVKNEGPTDAQDVSLTVYLPRGMTFGQASQPGVFDVQTHCVQWKLSSLGAGKTKTIVLSAVARDSGTQQGRLVLTAGNMGQREMTWKANVMVESAASH